MEGIPFPGWSTWTCNGILAKEGTAQLGPLYQQRTGDPRCTPKSLGACGNLWSTRAVDPRLPEAVRSCVNFLRHVAYQGVFGLDILLPEDGSPARVIEVNPRLTSGFSMEAMIGAWDPSGDLIDGLLNMESGEEIEDISLPASPIAAAQAVLYGSHDVEGPVETTIPSGRYTLNNGNPTHVDSCADLHRCQAGEGIVLARSRGHRIGAHGELARIQVWGEESDLTDWLDWLRESVRV